MKVATIIKAKREPELVIEWNACEVVSFHVTERRRHDADSAACQEGRS